MDSHEVSLVNRSRFGHVCNHFTTTVRRIRARPPWYSFHPQNYTNRWNRHPVHRGGCHMILLLCVHVRVDRNTTYLLYRNGFFLGSRTKDSVGKFYSFTTLVPWYSTSVSVPFW